MSVDFMINMFYLWTGGFIFSFVSTMLEMDTVNSSEEMEDEEPLTPTDALLSCSIWPVTLLMAVFEDDEEGD